MLKINFTTWNFVTKY